MTPRSDFVLAMHALRDDVLAVREKFGDRELFSRNLSRFIKLGKSGRRLVELSLVSDCLRAFAFIRPEFDESDILLGDVRFLLNSIASVKKESSEFRELKDGQIARAFSYFREDTGPFGNHHESSMWSGMETCANADALSPDCDRLNTYRSIISNWLNEIETEVDVMNLPKFGPAFAKCKGPNVQLRPNVLCRVLQDGDDRSKKQEIRVPVIAQRIAYWELLELTRENGLQFDSSLRDRHRLTPRQKLELEKFLDPGRKVRHLWPESERAKFRPFPRSFTENPFEHHSERVYRAEALVSEPESAEETTASRADSEEARESHRVVEPSTNGSPERAMPVVGERRETSTPNLSAEDEKSIIIDSPFEVNHIVFAPPGTGKTFALVKRLAKLVSEGQIDNPSRDVLILSFSRAAIAEIVKRMDDEAIESGNNNLRYLQISTFDSFAARSMTMGASPIKLANSYAKNIDMFCKLLSDRELPEESLDQIDQIKLLVVDEIQDLVGERARMTLTLMQQVIANGGTILLLGDPAQAIYDWQLAKHDTMTSSEFVCRAKSLMAAAGNGFEQRTFDHYHRFENKRLLDFVRLCRNAIGDDGSSPDMTGLRNQLNRFGTTIPEERLSAESTSTHSVAVLTRTNLEAYQLSKWCDENAINHRVERGASGRYWPGWIARLCFGFEQTTMSLPMIKRRWEKLVSENVRGDISTALEYLTYHGVYQGQQLDMDSLSKLIEKSQPLILWPLGDDCGMTVSTIHRSKGLQFDRVAILEPEAGNFSGGDSSNDNENARVIYVAATRAKSELLRLSRNRAILRKGFKRCSRKSWSKLQHFRLWNSADKTNQFLLDGIEEFDLIDYMKTVKSNSFKEIHETIWLSRSLSAKLEAIYRNSCWVWQLNGKRLCRVSPELESTLSKFNAFLSYHETELEKLSLVPIVDVASVSFAWRGDRDVEKALGKARLALLPVVYGLALVEQAAPAALAETS